MGGLITLIHARHTQEESESESESEEDVNSDEEGDRGKKGEGKDTVKAQAPFKGVNGGGEAGLSEFERERLENIRCVLFCCVGGVCGGWKGGEGEERRGAGGPIRPPIIPTPLINSYTPTHGPTTYYSRNREYLQALGLGDTRAEIGLAATAAKAKAPKAASKPRVSKGLKPAKCVE